MTVLAIARASGQRLLRDRTALFFLIVLPVVLIVVVGAVARGFGSARIGVLDKDATPSSRALVAAIEQSPGLSVVTYHDLASLETAVARSDVSAGVVVPRGLAAAEQTGGTARIGIVAERANSTQQAAATRVTSVLEEVAGRVQAAQFASGFGGSFSENLRRVEAIEARTPRVELVSRVVKASQATLPAGYEYSAPTELVLFVFLSAVAGGATIVESRRLHMFERMLAAPVRPRTVVLGESVTYLVVALGQSALIVLVGSLGFGVSWGDPLGAVVLVLLWCLVGAGAGMVSGTLFRTPEQASAIGPVVGIAFAMLGGCMWPLSIVSPAMRAAGHLTPHAWAVDAWTTLIADHGGLVAISGELAVLALFAAGLFAVATWRLRSMLLRAGA